MTEEIYNLPSTLLPCKPVDGPDIRCPNHSHPSYPNIWKDVLNIVSYDDAYFSSPHLTVPPKFNYDRDVLKFIHPFKHTPFPSIVELHDKSNTIPSFPVIDPRPTTIVKPHTLQSLSLLLPDSTKFFLNSIYSYRLHSPKVVLSPSASRSKTWAEPWPCQHRSLFMFFFTPLKIK